MNWNGIGGAFGVLLGALCAFVVSDAASPPPEAWGGDHVGKPFPEFATGDECLFCHRNTVGPAWGKNWHNQTIREATADLAGLAALKKDPTLKDFAKDVTLVLGGRHDLRFLKPNGAYGKFDLLSTAAKPSGELRASANPHWDTKQFADGCAGCHATAVDAKTRAFATPALDCFTCHGDVPGGHTKDTSLVYLSKKRQDPARVITSICAQCHVRTGASKSTGLPYPNQFVAGDNLFRDFQVELSPEKIAALNPADRHVLENIRAVVVLGKEDTTCLSCHEVHKQSTKKHHLAPVDASCATCHNPTGSKKIRKPYTVHSATCGY